MELRKEILTSRLQLELDGGIDANGKPVTKILTLGKRMVLRPDVSDERLDNAAAHVAKILVADTKNVQVRSFYNIKGGNIEKLRTDRLTQRAIERSNEESNKEREVI